MTLKSEQQMAKEFGDALNKRIGTVLRETTAAAHENGLPDRVTMRVVLGVLTYEMVRTCVAVGMSQGDFVGLIRTGYREMAPELKAFFERVAAEVTEETKH